MTLLLGYLEEATKRVPQINRLLVFCRKVKVLVIFTAFVRTNNYLNRPASGDSMPNRLLESKPLPYRGTT
jgi:hypothetical protein